MDGLKRGGELNMGTFVGRVCPSMVTDLCLFAERGALCAKTHKYSSAMTWLVSNKQNS